MPLRPAASSLASREVSPTSPGAVVVVVVTEDSDLGPRTSGLCHSAGVSAITHEEFCSCHPRAVSFLDRPRYR